MNIRLIVIRSADPDKLVRFYRLLGFVFEEHRHDKGPLHYAASIGDCVLEIYPLAKNQPSPDPDLRIGFTLDHFEESIVQLQKEQTFFVQKPMDTEFGYLAVVTDPEGRKIELYRPKTVI